MNERVAVLLFERDRDAAGFQQAEHVAGRAVGEPALVGNDIVLGAVAGGDVVLGDQRHQVGAAGELVDPLGLAFGDQRARGALRGGWRLGVHGCLCLSCEEKRRRIVCASPDTKGI